MGTLKSRCINTRFYRKAEVFINKGNENETKTPLRKRQFLTHSQSYASPQEEQVDHFVILLQTF